MGLLSDPDVVGHLVKYQMKPRRWKKTDVLRDALKYPSKSAWKAASSGAYNAAQAGGYFDEAVAHMSKPIPDVINRKGRAIFRWTAKRVIEDAARYQSKPEWKAASGGAFVAARRLGCFDEATKHMTVLNPKGKWNTKQSVLDDARKYQTRAEWMRMSSGAYEAAKKNDWFEEAVAHMKVLRRRKARERS